MNKYCQLCGISLTFSASAESTGILPIDPNLNRTNGCKTPNFNDTVKHDSSSIFSDNMSSTARTLGDVIPRTFAEQNNSNSANAKFGSGSSILLGESFVVLPPEDGTARFHRQIDRATSSSRIAYVRLIFFQFLI